jgi:hypothetical protein
VRPGGQVLGIDAALAPLERARQRSALQSWLPVEWRHGDALATGLDDGWEWVRKKIIELAGERGEWAGYPIPTDDAKLVIEPSAATSNHSDMPCSASNGREQGQLCIAVVFVARNPLDV